MFFKFLRDYKGFSTEFWITLSALFLNRAGTMIVPFLALYFSKQSGMSLAEAAKILGCAGVAGISANFIAGYACDRFSARATLMAALFLSATAAFLFLAVNGFYPLLLVTMLFSFANEAFRPAQMALVAELAQGQDMKKAYALVRLVTNVGLSIGPPIAGLLILSSYSGIFFGDGITALLAGVILVGISLSKRRGGKAEKKVDVPFSIRNLVVPDLKLWTFLSGFFLMVFLVFQDMVTLPLHFVSNLKLSPVYGGLSVMVNTVIVIVFQLPLTSAIGNWSYRKSFGIGCSLIALGFMLRPFCESFSSFCVAMIVLVIGEMMIFPAAGAYVIEIADPEMRGKYMGAFSTSMSVAVTVAPFLSVALLNGLGANGYWLFDAALSFVGLGIFIFVLQMKSRRTGFEATSEDTRASNPEIKTG